MIACRWRPSRRILSCAPRAGENSGLISACKNLIVCGGKPAFFVILTGRRQARQAEETNLQATGDKII